MKTFKTEVGDINIVRLQLDRDEFDGSLEFDVEFDHQGENHFRTWQSFQRRLYKNSIDPVKAPDGQAAYLIKHAAGEIRAAVDDLVAELKRNKRRTRK